MDNSNDIYLSPLSITSLSWSKCYFFSAFGEGFKHSSRTQLAYNSIPFPLVCGIVMSIISDLVAASVALQHSRGLSYEELDHRIKDHVATIRQLLSTKTLESLAHDEIVLDVSSTLYSRMVSMDKD